MEVFKLLLSVSWLVLVLYFCVVVLDLKEWLSELSVVSATSSRWCWSTYWRPNLVVVTLNRILTLVCLIPQSS